MKRVALLLIALSALPLAASAASEPQGRTRTLTPRTHGPQPRTVTFAPHH